MSKPYFHELSQGQVNALLKRRVTIGHIQQNYRRPAWCNCQIALEGQSGCWSLMDLTPAGNRTRISEEFCKTCLYFTP
jgi:hypothetical protein